MLRMASGYAQASGAPPEWLQPNGGMPPLRAFTARDTGVSTMAWSAVQDQAGILHFGCDTVVSFDGDRWRAERMDPTYAIRGLDVGPDGRVWAAGVNQVGWFEPGALGRLEYHSLIPRLPAGAPALGDVWRVYAEGVDKALFVTRDRVLRWNAGKFVSWDYPGGRVLWSTRTPKGIYVHYPPLGLLKWGAAGPSIAAPASVVGTSDIRWLDDSGDDWLLVTAEGLKILRNGVCMAQESEASLFVRANTPTCGARLRGGLLAIGTIQGGVVIADPSGGISRVFNRDAGLPANPVYSLLVDRDGALWAMGPSYILRLSIGAGVAVYGERSGYPAGGCESVAEFDGETFAVSHSDLLRISGDASTGGTGRFRATGITSNRFYSLLSTPQGLVVGHYHGLGLWTPRAMRQVIKYDGDVYRTVASQARPGTILVSRYESVLRVDPRTGESTVLADSLPDYGDSMVDEPSGRLWIGTATKGLFVSGPGYSPSRPAAPRFGDIPSAGPVLVSRSGSTVIAVAAGEAFFLDSRRDRFVRVAGFPEGVPSAISNPVAGGPVWAALDPEVGGHSPRLGKITVAADGAVWTPHPVEGLSGIGSLLALHVVAEGEGEALWIAGSESLVRAGPEALADRAGPRRPILRAWAREDGGRETRIEGPLPYANRGIHVEYSSLDYGLRDSERFQTMLAGAENEWSPPTDAADRYISGLREGSYDFKVRVRSDSGSVGDAAVLHFVIAPPWWRTALAYAVEVLACAASLYAFIRLRISALKRRAQVLEEMVRQRTAQLEKANAAKTEFVASMSHEIRNPMGGILGSAIELSQTPLGPEQRELVSTLRNCASFLASLVEDVLDFAQIEAGAYTVARSPFSPKEVLHAVAKMLEPGSAGARIDCDLDPGLPAWILGDSARVQQVMVNFAANSLKFGGRHVRLCARPEGSLVEFSVRDDGAGIPAEEQKNLFIRFSRLKSVRNSAVPGTGLGLAVSRALAERMGGSVGVESAPGRGSTFFLRLPMEETEAASKSRRFDARGARALVVEDIEYSARALGVMLGRLGFEVEFAVDGAQALARMSSESYRAVFLDCDLPGTGGVDVARAFRASESGGARTFIVATTALSTVGDREACLRAGMDDFLTKPITPEKLRAVLAGHGGLDAQDEPAPRPSDGLVVEPRLIHHLSDGTAEGMAREILKFEASLDEAMQGLASARAAGSAAALASAAHRVLAHARMVGATALAGTAADLQEFAGVYTEKELAEELALLARQSAELREALGRVRHPAAAPPVPQQVSARA